MASSNNIGTITEIIDVIPQRIQGTNQIFLQTTAAQVIAGLFVWTAVFVTCQQVKFINFYNTFCLHVTNKNIHIVNLIIM